MVERSRGGVGRAGAGSLSSSHPPAPHDGPRWVLGWGPSTPGGSAVSMTTGSRPQASACARPVVICAVGAASPPPSPWTLLDGRHPSCFRPAVSMVTHVFPPKRGLAVLAVDVGHSMQAGEQDALLRGAAAHVHPAGGRSWHPRRARPAFPPAGCSWDPGVPP